MCTVFSMYSPTCLVTMSHLHGQPNKGEQERQCTYNVILRRVSATIIAVEQQWVLRILRFCVCRLRYPACNPYAPYCQMCGLPRPTIFFKLSHIRHDFRDRKKVTEHKMCVSIFSTNFVWNTFHSKKTWANMIKNVYWSSCKVPFILFKFTWNLHFLGSSSKNTRISNFIKTRPVRDELFNTDRRTDRHKANRRFSQFCESA
jgi:hypothetical protein